MIVRGYEPVIGLEIHVQLKTKSKMFSADSTNFNGHDNENTSTVSVGLPGALPVINREAVMFSIKTGLALGCQVREKSIFARKNYFYPDLPKGYQISQYDKPLCEHGEVRFIVDGEEKKISITRAHMEEDAGKSIHQGNFTLVNFNRSGVPLLEVVSGPDLRSPADAAAYARTVRQIVRYLGVCDGNLEEGSLRCDCNVSVRRQGTEPFGTKVEIKNVNSFRFVEKAIEFEIDRQIDAIEAGEKIVQETRLWDPDKNRTFSMRTKEDAQDYRYFPDPDLLPVVVGNELINRLRSELPELPIDRAQRFASQLGLPIYDSLVLTSEKELADYFEEAVIVGKNAKSCSNWIMTELLRELNAAEKEISQSPIKPRQLGELVALIEGSTISGKIGKTVFLEMWASGQDPQIIVKEKGLVQITDRAVLEALVDKVMAANQGPLAEYRAGKTKLFGFFVGAVMKASGGQAHPELSNAILKEKLG